MGNVCGVCRHEQAGEIGVALVSGASTREVAARYGLSHSAVWRHSQQHISSAVKAELSRESAASGRLARPVLDQVGELHNRVQAVLERAEQAENSRTLLAASQELRRILELTARLTGELKPAGPAVVNVDLREMKPEPEPDLSMLSREQLCALDALNRQCEHMGIVVKVVELRPPEMLTIEAPAP